MITLDFRKFSYYEELSRDIVSLLVSEGAILLRDFPAVPDNGPLLQFVEQLRRPTTLESLNEPAANLENGFVHQVQAIYQPVRTIEGFLVTSTTSDAFPPHTDQYLCEDPADVVLFHCFVQSKRGGETMLVHIEQIIGRLDSSAIEELSLRYP